MINNIIEKVKELISGTKEDTTLKKTTTLILIFGLLVVLWQTYKFVAEAITDNWQMMLGFIVVIVVIFKILDFFHKKPENTDIIVPNEKMLAFNYRIIRNNLFRIIPDIAVSLGLISPSLPSKLNAPVRHKFLGKTAIYNYIMLIKKVKKKRLRTFLF
jgi:hypothetical protein